MSDFKAVSQSHFNGSQSNECIQLGSIEVGDTKYLVRVTVKIDSVWFQSRAYTEVLLSSSWVKMAEIPPAAIPEVYKYDCTKPNTIKLREQLSPIVQQLSAITYLCLDVLSK